MKRLLKHKVLCVATVATLMFAVYVCALPNCGIMVLNLTLFAQTLESSVEYYADDNGRQAVKTYTVRNNVNDTSGNSAENIPREDFTENGWLYKFSELTSRPTTETDTRRQSEAVTISTDTNNLDTVLRLLPTTKEYQGADGYSGTLTLDVSSVKCTEAGRRSVTTPYSASREYTGLSANDVSLIPKTISDGGKTLTLTDVSWKAQYYGNAEIPDSYNAVAKYSGNTTASVVSGYNTSANYVGEVTRIFESGTVYTLLFDGEPIVTPSPEPTATPSPSPTPSATPTPMETETETPAPTDVAAATDEPTETPNPQGASGTGGNSANGGDADAANKPSKLAIGLLIAFVVLLLVGGAATYWFLIRNNAKIYAITDKDKTLKAKARVSAKHSTIDLSALDGGKFLIEIDKISAKFLNKVNVDVVHNDKTLSHKIANEGKDYKIEVDFNKSTIRAVFNR